MTKPRKCSTTQWPNDFSTINDKKIILKLILSNNKYKLLDIENAQELTDIIKLLNTTEKENYLQKLNELNNNLKKNLSLSKKDKLNIAKWIGSKDLPELFINEMNRIIKNYAKNKTYSNKKRTIPTISETNAQLSKLDKLINTIATLYEELEEVLYADEHTLDLLEMAYIDSQLPISKPDKQPIPITEYFIETCEKIYLLMCAFRTAKHNVEKEHLLHLTNSPATDGRKNLAVQIGLCLIKHFNIKLTSTDPIKNEEKKVVKIYHENVDQTIGAFTKCVQLAISKTEKITPESNIQQRVIRPALKIIYEK